MGRLRGHLTLIWEECKEMGSGTNAAILIVIIAAAFLLWRGGYLDKIISGDENPTPMPTPTPTPIPSSSNIVVNGGFEDGSNSWLLSGHASVTSIQAHTGVHSALLSNNGGYSYIRQSFTSTVDSNNTSLTFWLLGTVPNDQSHVVTCLIHYSEGNLNSYYKVHSGNYVLWTQFTPNIILNHHIDFVSIGIGSGYPYGTLYLDDVSLMVIT